MRLSPLHLAANLDFRSVAICDSKGYYSPLYTTILGIDIVTHEYDDLRIQSMSTQPLLGVHIPGDLGHSVPFFI